MSTFGRIDVLVNAAGIARFAPFPEMSELLWDRVIDINVRGFFLCSRDVAREMVRAGRGGRIINVVSWGDLPQRPVEWRKGLTYATAQRAVFALTYAVAGELRPLGVQVHLVSSDGELGELSRALGEVTGKVALITGAGNNRAAREAARQLASAGARVLVAGGAADADMVTVPADLTTAAGVAALFERVGRVDILVNAAGWHSAASCLEVTDAGWDVSQDLAVKSYFLTCQFAARTRAQAAWPGAIVNLAWWGEPEGTGPTRDTGRRDLRARGSGGVAYGVSKHAGRTLTQVMALELARYGITVNGIGPGAVVTNVLKHLSPEEESRGRASPEQVPLGRQSIGADIAGTAVFLASDEAAFITGITINVDGGLSAAASDRALPGGIW